MTIFYDGKGTALPDTDLFSVENEEPMIGWARIFCEKTEDGMFSVDPKFVGSRVAVNLRTMATGVLYNVKTKQHHARPIVYKIEAPDEWIPLELLEIEL